MDSSDEDLPESDLESTRAANLDLLLSKSRQRNRNQIECSAMKFIGLAPFIQFSLVLHITLSSTVFISDFGMSKMIELSTKSPFCVVQIDRGKIREKLLGSDPRRVRKMSDEAVNNLAQVCNDSIQSPHQGGFIYPGTKWCGPGNNAKDYSDLGYHSNEDICCREHDMCPKSLSKGECKQGICNNSLFTRSHCDCDAAFRKCLQNANTEAANTIGAIFFNIVQVICFKERTPCTQWQSYYYDLYYGDQECPIYFEYSGRFNGTKVENVDMQNKIEHTVNRFLRKLRLL